MFRIIATYIAFTLLTVAPLPVAAQTELGTAFTYQGRLNTAGSPASGVHSFEFSLFDSPEGGSQVGTTQSVDAEVDGGLFNVPLDFGSSAFNGDKRWLEISVQAPGDAEPTLLSPRVEISAAPYAQFAAHAKSMGSGTLTEASGNIGIATDNPELDLHIRAGDTPAIRFEQTSELGWYPQTWDIGANEANFFIRDITKGINLPFRIRPGAPESSIDIAADGKVGIGTASPKAKLHITGTAGTDGIKFPDNTLQVTAYNPLQTSATLASSSVNPWTSRSYSIPAPGAQPSHTAIVNLDVNLWPGLVLSNIRCETDKVHFQIQNISDVPLTVPAGIASATVLR